MHWHSWCPNPQKTNGVLLCLLRFTSVTCNMYSLGAQGALLCTKNKQTKAFKLIHFFKSLTASQELPELMTTD